MADSGEARLFAESEYVGDGCSPNTNLCDDGSFFRTNGIARLRSYDRDRSRGPLFPGDRAAIGFKFLIDGSTTHKFDFIAYRPAGPQAVSYQWLDNVTLAQVPEPSCLAMLVLGASVLSMRRR